MLAIVRREKKNHPQGLGNGTVYRDLYQSNNRTKVWDRCSDIMETRRKDVSIAMQ